MEAFCFSLPFFLVFFFFFLFATGLNRRVPFLAFNSRSADLRSGPDHEITRRCFRQATERERHSANNFHDNLRIPDTLIAFSSDNSTCSRSIGSRGIATLLRSRVPGDRGVPDVYLREEDIFTRAIHKNKTENFSFLRRRAIAPDRRAAVKY